MTAFRSLIVNDEPAPAYRKCRSDYRALPTNQIHRLVGKALDRLDRAETNAEQFEEEFLIQELRAVLLERARAA